MTDEAKDLTVPSNGSAAPDVKDKTGRSGVGGSAMSGGAQFEHRGNACIAARIVAEATATPGWGLPPGVTLRSFRFNTEQPVDDWVVGTSAGGYVYGQSKASLDLSEREDSDLASACDQFVRQYARHTGAAHPVPPDADWERPLDPDRDRLVLLTSHESPATIRVTLVSALRRIRDGLSFDKTIAKDELRARNVLIAHLRRYLDQHKPAYTEADVSRLCSLIRIDVLDVSDEGSSVRETENLLRAVLVDPTRSADAFRLLDQKCEDLAVRRSGEDRGGFCAVLSAAGLLTSPSKSYRADIERLRTHTTAAVDFIRRLSRIAAGTASAKIVRAVTDVVIRAAADGPLLVTGEPGSGKSGVAHDAAVSLQLAGSDVVVLAADLLGAQSLGQLRQELGIEHDLVDVLDEWSGPGAAYLFVDALDAARSSASADALRQLIADVQSRGGRWRVVAVVRQYDLRHSIELQRLFRSAHPATAAGAVPAMLNVRHVLVRPFDDGELAEVAKQSQVLGELLAAANDHFRTLLAEPFNLSLAAELVNEGVLPSELGGLRSRTQLLDRYWQERVLKRDPDDREAVLGKACVMMISRRQLRADRRDVHEPGTKAVAELLSGGPLTQWRPRPDARPDDYAIAFSHNVLFDYAVARLLLRGPADRAVAFLEKGELDLPMLLRPSLSMHARHLWETDRDAFWTFALACSGSTNLGGVVKLVAPAEAAAMADDPDDFDPVAAAVDLDPTPGSAAVTVLRHLTGALMAGVAQPFGPKAMPWYLLMERASRTQAPPVQALVRQLVMATNDPAKMEAEQRRLFNLAARRLLEHVLDLPNGNKYLSDVAIEAVCQSLAAAPAESAALIRRLLDADRLARRGSDELFRVACDIDKWTGSDPALAEDVFKAAFAAPLPEATPTELFGSRIISGRSTKKQDFEVTLHALADDFLGLLTASAAAGARVAGVAIDAYVRSRYWSDGEKRDAGAVFQFGGAPSGILRDGSTIWNNENSSNDPAVQIVHSLMEEVRRLAVAGDPRLGDVVAGALAGTKPAMLWAEFLQAGAEHPRSLGCLLVPLLTVPEILHNPDTRAAAAAMLSSTYPAQSPDVRELIEVAIAAVGEHSARDARVQKFYARMARELFESLPGGLLVTEAARRAHTSEPVASATSPTTVEDIPAGACDPQTGVEIENEADFDVVMEDVYLSSLPRNSQGVIATGPADAQLLAAVSPAEAFVRAHPNGTPPAETLKTTLAILKKLHEAILAASSAGEQLREYSWQTLAAAAIRLTHIESAVTDPTTADDLRKLLLEASRATGAGRAAQEARYNAVGGLLPYAMRGDAGATSTLLTLTKDPAEAVRRRAIGLLPQLQSVATDASWQAVEERVSNETDPKVLETLIGVVSSSFTPINPRRAHAALDAIASRAASAGDALAEVSAACLVASYFMWVFQGHEPSGESVLAAARKPVEHAPAICKMLSNSRKLLVLGPADTPDPAAEVRRGRVVRFFEAVATASAASYVTLAQRFQSVKTEEQRAAPSGLYEALWTVGHEAVTAVYYGTDAYEVGKAQKSGLTKGQRQRAWRELSPTMRALAQMNHPAISHSLIEGAATFATFDPPGVFLLIRDAVVAGTSAGLQYESLAADTVSNLVETYLADHRSLLQIALDLRKALLEVLQIFIDWPKAQRLVYRLDEIDR
jgi:hypothetical protein